MTLLNGDQQRTLVSELVTVVKKYSPEWTGSNPGDPGVTLLELFSWLADTLLFRATAIPERKRRVLKQLLSEFNRISRGTS